jgi:SAM-dependent methyltransferase
MPSVTDRERDATIADFGAQWTRFTRDDGFYASQELWRDIVGPLVPVDGFAGKRVVDVGSGTGRIVNMLLDAGATEVIAIEPSEAFPVLEANVAARAGQVRCHRLRGDQLGELPRESRDVDWVVSIGVLHHIPDPNPVVCAARALLRHGGHILVWVYGREGNATYLALVLPLRRLTRWLPPRILEALSWMFTPALSVYAWLCRRVPSLPLGSYLVQVISPLTWQKRMLVIYDQLAPAWAEYYDERRARALLENAGFVDIRLHHRHGYSWTVIGTNPGQ